MGHLPCSAEAPEVRLNGEIRQDANPRDLVLDIPGMIEMAVSVMTLYPGGIIATGTPSGEGPMRPGDKVKIEIELIDTQVRQL